MAKKLFLVPIDLNKNELQNAVIQNLAGAPASPLEGQVYNDTTAHKAYYYNGSGWVPMDGSSPPAGSIPATALTEGGIDNGDIAAGAAIALSKLATDPLARANHTGTQLAATVSDFDTQVRTSRLDQMAAPTADVSANNHKLTSVSDPTNPQDAATKAYVDARSAGLDPHNSTLAATTAALPANTYNNGAAGVGATLTGNANGALAAIDGYTPVLNDRILVKNEAAAANNGVYVVTQVGTGGTPYILTRATDFDQAAEINGGAFFFVEQGTANGSGGFVISGSGPWVVGTTAITFVQFTGAGEIVAGTGLTKVGNTLSVTTPFTKYAGDIGDGATTAITVTHNLNTKDVIVRVFDKTANGTEVECQVDHNGVNTVVLTFTVAPTAAQYRVVAVG
jgi:hypothetical protein